MFHHEIWRDEAQVWCIVRDMSFIDVFKTSRLEGHPSFWYMLLFPFAKLGLPVFSMQIVSLVFVFIAVNIFLFKSPFNNYQKAVIVLGNVLLYYMPTIARNYCLIPIFIFLLATIYPQRQIKPYLYSILIILLSQTHLLMLGFCAILAFIFSLERLNIMLKDKKPIYLMPILLLFANFIILAVMFIHAPQENYAISSYAHRDTTLSFSIIQFVLSFFPHTTNFIEPFAIIAFSVVTYFILNLFFKSDKKMFTVYMCSFLYLVYIFACIWYGGVNFQKAYTILLVLLFCYWNCENKSKSLSIIISMIFTINFIYSFFDIYREIKYQFSASKPMAQYIKNNVKSNTICVIGNVYLYTAISAYLPDKKLYSLNENDYFTYYDFLHKPSLVRKNIECKYYLTHYSINMDDNYKLLYKTSNYILSHNGDEAEVFKLYMKK